MGLLTIHSEHFVALERRKNHWETLRLKPSGEKRPAPEREREKEGLAWLSIWSSVREWKESKRGNERRA